MEKIPINLPKEITDKYEINRNTFIRKDKGEKAEEREVEIGDVLQDDFIPQVKLKQWDNETNFSVRLIDKESDKPKIETEGNKIKFIKNKLEAHFYDIEKGFEFEVLLKEKPATNKIEMNIESKGLKFSYQPSLKEEHKIGQEGAVEITDTDVKDKDGKVICHRPENVVGSYAVYHESKAGDYSKMGLKNYRAGKAFHIFRPRIIDSAGTEVWGKLNITDNLLTVEIPQEFLDNAVYPVRHAAGLRFGEEGVGGSVVYVDDQINGSVFAGAAGIGDSISIYRTWYQFGTVAKCAVYIHSNSSLLTNGVTEEKTKNMNWTDTGWETHNFSSSPTLTAVDYVLVGWADNSNSLYGFYYDDGEGTIQGHYDAEAYNGFPATASFTHEDKKYSIYCTYTAGGAAFTPKAMFFTFLLALTSIVLCL